MYGPTAYRGGTTWDCTLQTTRLRAWTSGELAKLLTQTGFPRLSMYGSYDMRPYEPLESADIIIEASGSAQPSL